MGTKPSPVSRVSKKRKRGEPSSKKSKKSSCQVLSLKWADNKSPVSFGSGGGVYLLSSFAQGTNEYNRHTNTTYTEAVSIKAVVSFSTKNKAFCGTGRLHWWIVIDKTPPGEAIANNEIFDCFFVDYPSTWNVRRDFSERFIVKKYWSTEVTSNGYDFTKAASNGVPPERPTVCVNEYVSNINLTTVWLGDKSVGDWTSMKKGALYVCCAAEKGGFGPAQDISLEYNVAASFRVYFRSIGTQ